jgi:hypothetical protein
MAKVRVQVSLFSEPIEVEEGEIAGLRAQGILESVVGEMAGQPGTSGDGSSDGATAAAARKPRGTTQDVTGTQEA